MLPFHRLGRHKWHDLGIPYALDAAEGPDEALQQRVRSRFSLIGPPVH